MSIRRVRIVVAILITISLLILVLFPLILFLFDIEIDNINNILICLGLFVSLFNCTLIILFKLLEKYYKKKEGNEEQ